jgi:hypothetical protein
MTSPTKALLAGTIVVGCAPLALWHLEIATHLAYIVMFGAAGILARLSSEQFVDTHHGWLFTGMAILNLALFLIVAVPIWASVRRRNPKLASTLIACWSVFYLACLFFLFPAGPIDI